MPGCNMAGCNIPGCGTRARASTTACESADPCRDVTLSALEPGSRPWMVSARFPWGECDGEPGERGGTRGGSGGEVGERGSPSAGERAGMGVGELKLASAVEYSNGAAQRHAWPLALCPARQWSHRAQGW